MKKILIMIILATFSTEISAVSLKWFPYQEPLKKCWFSVGMGNIHSPGADLGSSSAMALDFDMMVAGVYVGFGSNFEHAKENQYGSGDAISDIHNMFYWSIGYGYNIYNDYTTKVHVFPYFIFTTVSDMMEDSYYGEDKIVKKHHGTGVGVGCSYIKNNLGVKMRLGTKDIGIGFCIGF